MADDGGEVAAEVPIIDAAPPADATPIQPKLSGSGSVRKTPTPPTGPPPAAASGLSSKLNSLKERRQTATPPQAQPRTPPKPADPAPGEVAVAVKTGGSKLPAPSPGAAPPSSDDTQGSKIPSVSPQRGRKLSPGRQRPDAYDSTRSASSGPRSPGRGSSPARDGGWNFYSRDVVPRAKQSPVVSGPSEEERAKRRQWAIEKRRKEEARARLDLERRQAEEVRKKAAEEAKLDARRAAIRDRIARQHEIAAKMAAERVAAEERARQDLQRFRAAKPLHERLMEEYERQRIAEEEAKKKLYDNEIARMRNVRPHQIIAGEVVIKPPPSFASPQREARMEISPVHERERGAPPAFMPHRGGVSTGAPRTSAGGSSPPGPYPDDGIPEELRRSGEGTASYSAPPRPPPRTYKDKPRTQGVVLYSTRAKAGAAAALPRLVERAASPFVFNEENQPVNVPDQTQFWNPADRKPAAGAKKGAPTSDVLTVEMSEDVLGLNAIEEADAPQQASPTEAAAAEAAAVAAAAPVAGSRAPSQRPSMVGERAGSKRPSIAGEPAAAAAGGSKRPSAAGGGSKRPSSAGGAKAGGEEGADAPVVEPVAEEAGAEEAAAAEQEQAVAGEDEAAAAEAGAEDAGQEDPAEPAAAEEEEAGAVEGGEAEPAAEPAPEEAAAEEEASPADEEPGAAAEAAAEEASPEEAAEAGEPEPAPEAAAEEEEAAAAAGGEEPPAEEVEAPAAPEDAGQAAPEAEAEVGGDEAVGELEAPAVEGEGAAEEGGEEAAAAVEQEEGGGAGEAPAEGGEEEAAAAAGDA